MSGSRLSREELAAANINPETGLATDYLNHFNEVAMLIDMLGSMPDVVEDVLDWTPITYPEHFLITGFRAKELAIEAFNQCDPVIRTQFEDSCKIVEDEIADVQKLLREDVTALTEPAATAAGIYELIAQVGGVINPSAADGSCAWANVEEGVAAGDDQAAIDALFD